MDCKEQHIAIRENVKVNVYKIDFKYKIVSETILSKEYNHL